MILLAMDAWQLTIILVIAGVAIAVAAAQVLRGQKRQSDLSGLAKGLGLEFDPDAQALPREELAGMALFTRGQRKVWSNLLHGKVGEVAVHLLDFESTSGAGKSGLMAQTVAIFLLPRSGVPAFEVRPERWKHLTSPGVGVKELDFPEQPGFTSVYTVRGADESAARRLLSPPVLSYLQDHPGWCIEGTRRALVLYRADQRIPPEDMGRFLDQALEMFYAFGLDAGPVAASGAA